MRRSTAVGTLCLFAATILSLTAHASAPLLLTHQGRLLDAADQPVTGSVELTFRIFETPAGGAELWSEVHPMVSASDGLFITTLGSLVPLSADILAPAGGGVPPVAIERWLEVQVATDPPLAPRVQLVAAPYAVVASRVSGDIETHPGEIEIKDLGKLLKDGVDNAKVHRIMSNTEDGQLNELTAVARKNKTFQKMTDSDIASRTAEISADSSGSSVVLEADDDGDGLSDHGVEARTSSSPSVKEVFVRGWDQKLSQSALFEIAAGDSGAAFNLTASHDNGENTDSVIIQTSRKSGSVILTDRMGTEVIRSGFANDSSGASAFLSADSDDDGVLESSILQISRPTVANLAIKTKGTSAQRLGSNIGATRDSAGVRSGYDENGDGINETEVSQVARKAMGRMKCSDVTLERAYLSVVSADSSGSSLSLDSKLNPNAARDNFLQGAADILQARLQLGSDSDNNGVTDNSVEQRSTNDSASVSTVSRFGSGPRQTTSMDGSFSHSRVTCASDLDADGLADNETEDFADAATARMRVIVQKHTLEPHEARMSADVAGPRIEISSASTVRASMSLDGVQVSDNSGTVVSEIGSDGNAYIAGNMKFGAVAGAHRIDVQGGAFCDGTNWSNGSDANSKENFTKVDGREILNKLDRLDITRWNYKGQADAAHIGPTAQDFRKVFGVGSDDKSISTIDPSGIALAAIKELNRQNQELREANELLLREILDIKKAVGDLRTSQ